VRSAPRLGVAAHGAGNQEGDHVDMLSEIRHVTGNLDRAVEDLKAGNAGPIVRAIASCETKLQSALLAAIVCSNLDAGRSQDLVHALATMAWNETPLDSFG
jgi:hypothetical protein